MTLSWGCVGSMPSFVGLLFFHRHEQLKQVHLLSALNTTKNCVIHSSLPTEPSNTTTNSTLEQTLAIFHKSSQCFQANFGVIHPHQKPPQSQAVFCAHSHTLFIFYLQLRQTGSNKQRTDLWTLCRSFLYVMIHLFIILAILLEKKLMLVMINNFSHK